MQDHHCGPVLHEKHRAALPFNHRKEIVVAKNYNCDGSHCRERNGEVRVYPIGGGANLILCASCAAHENSYRWQRGRETGRPEDFPQVNWHTCEPYPDRPYPER